MKGVVKRMKSPYSESTIKEKKMSNIKLLRKMIKEAILSEQNYNPKTESNKPLKYLSQRDGERLSIDEFPNFSASGNISGMKKQYYGKGALLVKCGSYIYHVSSKPDIYFQHATNQPTK